MVERVAGAVTPAAEGKDQSRRTTPVLIYIPGLGRSENNTADQVAESIRASLDPQRRATYGVVSAAGVPAPAGLKVSKTIVDEHDTEVLQVFEFNYGATLSPQKSGAVPAVVPGVVKSSAYTVAAVAMLAWAWKRPAKRWQTKVQLWLGVATCAALAFFALYSFVGLLTVLDVKLPSWVQGIFGEHPGNWKLKITSLGVVVTWAAARKSLLGLAAATQACIRFIRNIDVVADSISEELNQAIDGLRPSGWTGPVHLLGYSFGSLVLFETFFPRKDALRHYAPPREVSSMVTIGCPLDMVRLFTPRYVNGRTARDSGLHWTNLFIEADVFASNLTDGDDKSAGPGSVAIDGVIPESIRYTDKGIKPLQIFTSGKMHAGYWGKGRASCFGDIAPALVALHPED